MQLKVYIKREEILKAIGIVFGAIEKKTSLPILSNILFTVKEKYVQITATDLEIEISTKISENIEILNVGVISVNARKIFEICKSVKINSLIEFSHISNDEKLLINSGKSKFQLALLNPESFPKIDLSENLERKNSFTIEQKILKALLKKVYFSIAHHDVRYYLNGILFEVDDSVVSVVATDGHRLSLAKTNKLNNISKKKFLFILPKRAASELSRLTEELNYNVKISVYEKHIALNFDNFSFISKMIDGKFPNYYKIIEDLNSYYVDVDRQDFKEAIARASILANEQLKGIKLTFENKSIYISSNNTENETANEEIVAENNIENSKVSIIINSAYLIDVCNSLTCRKIRLSFEHENRAIFLYRIDINNIKDNGIIHIIMPMKI